MTRAREPELTDTAFEWSIVKHGGDGSVRELRVSYDPDRGPRVLVVCFWDSEHALMPLDRHETRALMGWLEDRVGRDDPAKRPATWPPRPGERHPDDGEDLEDT
jgi:hypothetical protein